MNNKLTFHKAFLFDIMWCFLAHAIPIDTLMGQPLYIESCHVVTLKLKGLSVVDFAFLWKQTIQGSVSTICVLSLHVKGKGLSLQIKLFP